MDILLNTTSNYSIKDLNSLKKKKSANKRKQEGDYSNTNGFSFTFTNKSKVKAIVARKRKIFSKDKIYNEDKQTRKTEINEKYLFKSKTTDATDSNSYEETERNNKSDLRLNVSTKIPSNKDLMKGKNYELKELPEKSKDTLKLLPKSNKTLKKKAAVRIENLFTDDCQTKILGQRLVKPVVEKVFTGVPVSSLNLHQHIIKNLSDLFNINELTTVQQMTIPKALEGKDCLVRSQTGSGKTLAYALPVIQKLQEIRPKLTRDKGIQAVIIVPTRELVIQTYELFLKFLKPFTWLVPGMLTGGENRKAEKARIRKGITILIGTPGRVCDHLVHTESFKLDKVKFLVLDEADRLLELGYEQNIQRIVEGINDHKAGRFTKANNITENQQCNISSDKLNSDNLTDVQILLLSATLTPAIQKLAGLTLKEPLFIDTSDENSTVIQQDNYEDALERAMSDAKLVIPATVDLSYIVVPPKLRLVTLAGILAKECKNKKCKAFVFMSTTEMVNFHNDLLNEALTNKKLDEESESEDDDDDDEDESLLGGITFFKLHGSMTQQERSGVFNAFRQVKSGVLLTTDVAGRGIDVPEVDLVIQYSSPQNIPEFVHRVGRTGRAGRNGRAILFLAPTEIQFVRLLEQNRIRISQQSMEFYLNTLVSNDSSANNLQEATSNLQHKFEEIVAEDKEMHNKACEAFVSWIRLYAAFPKDLKSIFNVKTAHMGHFAKSFCLREEPKSFTRKHTLRKVAPTTNKLSFISRSSDNQKDTKKSNKLHRNNNGNDDKLKRFLSTSRTLQASEYDSGLPPIKKKK